MWKNYFHSPLFFIDALLSSYTGVNSTLLKITFKKVYISCLQKSILHIQHFLLTVSALLSEDSLTIVKEWKRPGHWAKLSLRPPPHSVIDLGQHFPSQRRPPSTVNRNTNTTREDRTPRGSRCLRSPSSSWHLEAFTSRAMCRWSMFSGQRFSNHLLGALNTPNANVPQSRPHAETPSALTQRAFRSLLFQPPGVNRGPEILNGRFPN